MNNVHYTHALPKRDACNFHIYVGSAHFWPFKILNFNVFWGFLKNEGVWRNCGFYFLEGGGSLKKQTVNGRHLYAF